MKKHLLVIVCLLSFGCISQKPFFFAAQHQANPVNVSLGVFYDDFSTDEVRSVVADAADEFYRQTNIRPTIEYYQKMDWEARELTKMSEQVVAMYDRNLPTTWWVLMIYKKTPLEWVLLFLIGNVEGGAEVEKKGGGRWMFVNRLNSDLIIHEMYHLGYGIETHE